jgi:manganese/iron transport system substrate-binding protein
MPTPTQERRGLRGEDQGAGRTFARSGSQRIPENQRWLVTSEGAFSYLTRDYGMKEAYLWPINADEQGTPKQVRR